jgi:hypothetical protein
VTTAPPTLPYVFVPSVPLPLVPAAPSFQQTRQDAMDVLLAGAEAPLPHSVRRHQARVLSRVGDDLLATGATNQRLYVLEIAGPVPRVKIGRSNAPWVRIRQHVTDMNRYQYGLLDAHITDPLDDLLSITRAEGQAHVWMGRHHKPITREEFRDGDYALAVLCADIAVAVQTNQLQENAR